MTPSGRLVVRMWEARVQPGRLADAVTWLQDTVVPAALSVPGCQGAEALRAGASEERVVLVTRWTRGLSWQEPDPPPGLLARAHAWEFEPV